MATRQHLQQFANDVVNRCLHFLNARDLVAMHYDRKINQASPLDLTAVITEQRDGERISFALT